MNSATSHAVIEPLESRRFFAADLSALYGGSVLFARKDGGVNRVHTDIHINAQSAGGAISGRLDVNGLGNSRFNGSANNSLLFLIFNGSNGSGNLVASSSDDGTLKGEIKGTIGNVVTAGSLRLHSNGGTIGSDTVTDQFVNTTGGAGSSGTFNTSAIAGSYGGSVIFAGTTPLEATSSTRHRVHAVLNLETNIAFPDLLDGTFRMDHVGKYQVTGSTAGNQTVLVFTGGTGTGGMVLTESGNLPGFDPFVAANSNIDSAAINLSGKFFGALNGADLHAKAVFHNSAALSSTQAGAPSLNFGGIGSPMTPSILNGQAISAANANTTNPNSTIINTPSFINSGSSAISTTNSSTQLFDSTNPMAGMFGGFDSLMG